MALDWSGSGSWKGVGASVVPLEFRKWASVTGALAALLAAPIDAQVPAPHAPTPLRRVHPMIADPSGAFPIQSSPRMAVADGVWNHGEGFGPTPADRGAWFQPTDGQDLTLGDVHANLDDPSTPQNENDRWVPYSWTQPYLPLPTGHTIPAMERLEGYLRPASLGPTLPQIHPLYGPVGPYVDQGAFELFRPATPWNPTTQKILIVIHNKETATFPGLYGWTHIYRGFFSADGLVRNQVPAQTSSGFAGTDLLDADIQVERPLLRTLPFWTPSTAYWPIEGYIVLSTLGRSTTLNEQRHMQLLQAIKVMLKAQDNLNPLWNNATSSVTPLTDQQIRDKVVVVFTGGSNGGMQASLANLRYPHLVHGSRSEVINPSYQRLYSEFALDAAVAQLTAAGPGDEIVAENDFLVWNQYVWSHDVEMHDMSCLRHFVAGTTYRPFSFFVGDEDVTSTGTNWIRVLDGTQWSPVGAPQSPSSFGSPAAHRMAWSVGSDTRHAGNFGISNPYLISNPPTYFSYTTEHDQWPDVLAHRAQELQSAVSPPVPAVTHVARNQAQQLRGLDDPQEWWLGKPGDPIPLPAGGDPLTLDTAFSDAANPDATGSMPGMREAMFIKNGRVYVGSADGFVSCFYVDTANPKKPLRRQARSHRLGHECTGLGFVESGGTWWVVAGTRRNLYKLDKDTLQVQLSADLPWEVGRPHHIRCADVLPGHSGPEIVFASVYGGLCFYDLSLQPVYEWPEPGIYDYFIDGQSVTILSARDVIARVSFSGANHHATLDAASQSIPRHLLTYGAPIDPPCQGRANDLERMRANWTAGGAGMQVGAISSWGGDTDGASVRFHWLPGFWQLPYLPNRPAPILDIAPCMQDTTSDAIDKVGDHVLVLDSAKLSLYDQYSQLLGQKSLVLTTQGYYPFGFGAHHIVVGDLVPNSGTYPEEVVVATNTGLMWLHINELIGSGPLQATGSTSGSFLSGFWIEKSGSTTAANIQARTNQGLCAAWATARRPATAGGGLDSYLHVMDQRGAYWQVDYNGLAQLRDATIPVGQVRGWNFVGTTASAASGLNPECTTTTLGQLLGIQTKPWCPINADLVSYERSGLGLPYYVPNNWMQKDTAQLVFDGFWINTGGAAVVSKPAGSAAPGIEGWHWTRDPYLWGNLVQGWHRNTNSIIDGIWASTHIPQSTQGATGDLTDYLTLHSQNAIVPLITQQSVAAVNLTQVTPANQTAVVLGCPGGRVRVLRPGAMRTGAQTPPHTLGTYDETPDLGLGGSALAVRHEVIGGVDRIRIWFGTLEDPPARPVSYGITSATGALADSEVSAGAVHMVDWWPGNGFGAITTRTLHPGAFPGGGVRGGAGVVGLLVTDLVPASYGAAYAGDELVVGTLSGDLFLFNADTMQYLWHTHLPGSVGCFNSLRAEDLNSNGHLELYVPGSAGLWRFGLSGVNP